MKIIYLPGNSIKNKDEGDALTSFLIAKGFDVYYHQWNHWGYANQYIGWDMEAKKAEENIKSESELILIGKSIGSFVALEILKAFPEKIKKVIFLGIPVLDFDNPSELQEYPTTLKTLDVPIYVIQNSGDPHGKPEDVQDLLSEVKYELIERDRPDHVYNYSDEVLQCLQENIPNLDK